MARHKVKIAGLPTAATVAARAKETQAPIVVPQADPNNPNLVANLKANGANILEETTVGNGRKVCFFECPDGVHLKFLESVN